MMAWIELHQALMHHRKTLKAAALLRVDRHKLIGHLAAFWTWAVDNVPPSGSLEGIEDEVLAAGAEWNGRGDFIAALREVGFIDGSGLHDWYDFAGRLMDARAKNAERMRAARAPHVRRTFNARAPATQPNPTQPTQPNQPDQAAAAAPTRESRERSAFALYGDAFGQPVPNQTTADRLIDAEREYGADCLKHSLEEAALNEARSFQYVAAILKRHKAEGCQGDAIKPPPLDPLLARRRMEHEAKNIEVSPVAVASHGAVVAR